MVYTNVQVLTYRDRGVIFINLFRREDVLTFINLLYCFYLLLLCCKVNQYGNTKKTLYELFKITDRSVELFKNIPKYNSKEVRGFI